MREWKKVGEINGEDVRYIIEGEDARVIIGKSALEADTWEEFSELSKSEATGEPQRLAENPNDYRYTHGGKLYQQACDMVWNHITKKIKTSKKYYLVGYNGNIISRERSNQEPAYHIEDENGRIYSDDILKNSNITDEELSVILKLY